MKKRMTAILSITMMALFAGYVVVASGVHAADTDAKAAVKAAATEGKTAVKAGEAEAKSAVKEAQPGADSVLKPVEKETKVGTRPLSADTKVSDNKAMQCMWTGKISVKNETIDGKDVKTPFVLITEAKHADGKIMDMMKGMELKIIGAKAADALKMVGSDVEVKGFVAIDANSVALKTESKKVSVLN